MRARGETWRVVETSSFAECLLVALDGAGPTNNGQRRALIHPFDRFESAQLRSQPRVVPLRRWMNALGGLCAALVEHDHLVAAARADIDLLPYQLEPALAFLRGHATRLLLADEVGLGKTIEAGLILAELHARGMLSRALVLTPAGLRDQWAEELRGRFHLDVTIVDAVWLRRASFSLPAWVNPWATVPVALASVDFVKRPEVVRGLEPFVWDLLVVDEAHSAGSASDRGDAVRALAARARRVVLVTATPHAGDEVAYRSLCDLGRLDGRDGPILLFRRSRAQTGLPSTRRVHLLRVARSAAERRAQALLEDYTAQALDERGLAAQAHGTGETAAAARLALIVLQKRALSSAWALARSVARRLEGLTPDGEPLPAQMALPLADAEAGETDGADVEPADPLFAPALRDANAERALLARIRGAAVEAACSETKLAALDRLLRRVRERAIVFTEYRDTALLVGDRLASCRPVSVLHGGLARAERLAAERAFTRGPAEILVATDVGSEGLNLQASCRLVISLELPWNPVRIEQRIGRVERIGQRRAVHAVHLVAAGTREEEVLGRLAARVGRARQAIGFVPDVLGLPAAGDIQTAMLGCASLTPSPLTLEVPAPCVEEASASVERPAAWLAGAASSEAHHARATRAIVTCAHRHALRPDFVLATALRRGRLVGRERRSKDRSLTSSWLPTGILCIFRTQLVDEAGHLVEDLVEPMLAPFGLPRCRTVRDAREWLGRVGPVCSAAGVLARRSARERAAAAAAARAQGLALLALRERAIADRVERDFGLLARPVQAGLFDRRAERLAEDGSRAKAALDEQLSRPRQVGQVSVSGDPKLALVLLLTS